MSSTLGCRSIGNTTPTESPVCPAGLACSAQAPPTADDALAKAAREARLAEVSERKDPNRAPRHWLACAASAYAEMGAAARERAAQAATLAARCNERLLQRVLQRRAKGWRAGPMRLDGSEVVVEFRALSPWLQESLKIVRAADVPMAMYDGQRQFTPGFGVPLALVTPRCSDRPQCVLFPPEGIFQWATAWIEVDPARPQAPPRLVIADPTRTGPLQVGQRHYPLALDTSAFYALGASTSALSRLGVFGLFGGREIGRRAGLYLLQDYDPDKRPLVMIHGLGSSPLIWAKLSNAVWGDPQLRAHFQIWHVVHQTNSPLLVSRLRVQAYLDQTWQLLDPEGDDPARQGMVLVGHSMGGVVSRLLCVDSGDVLWNAAFTVPPGQLPIEDEADRTGIEATFLLHPYPGVTRAVFMASPHRGSPAADSWFGRLTRVLVGRRALEIQALRRLTLAHPEAVQDSVRESYRTAMLNSITTLQFAQPVRRAGETLMPAPGIAYHSIIGALRGREPQSDGVVPLSSALLAGANSTLVLDADHELYARDEAIAEVLRILREELALQQRADAGR